MVIQKEIQLIVDAIESEEAVEIAKKVRDYFAGKIKIEDES